MTALANLHARADCARYLTALDGAETGASGASTLKRANTGGIGAKIAALIPAAAAATRRLVEAVEANRPTLDWWSTYTEADKAGRGMATGMAM